MLQIQGLFEAHLTVARLENAVTFYTGVVGLELAHRVPERNAAFLWIGHRGHAMLGLWEVGTAPLSIRQHIAFTSTVDRILAAPDILKAKGIQPRGIHGEPVTEPIVIGWMPAISVYFLDPDGHLLEYLAMLPDKPDPEAGVVPYSRWRTLQDRRVLDARSASAEG